MNTLGYEAVFKRLQEATGCTTQNALAQFLGVRQSSVSDAVRRHSIPSDWLLKLLQKERINPDWILSGQGAEKLRADDDTVIFQTQGAEEPPGLEAYALEDLIAEVARRVASRL